MNSYIKVVAHYRLYITRFNTQSEYIKNSKDYRKEMLKLWR